MVEKLNIEIGLTGDEEIKRQLADTASAFTQATRNISQLGNTMAEALNSAAAAAKKFGASASELAGLETRIRAIGGRARDSGISFGELARRIDLASGATGNLAQASTAVGASFATLARIGGVVGGAIAAGLVLATKQTIGFAEAINKTSAEAIKLGISFKTLDKLKLVMEQAGMPAAAINSGIATLKGNLDKLEIVKLQKAVEEVQKLQKFARFAPGQEPDALKALKDAATEIGPAGDFARESLRKLEIELAKTSNIRFLPGVVPTLEQLKQNIDPVVAGFRALGIEGTKVGEQAGLVTQKLTAMTNVAERNRLALLLMGEAGGTAFIQTLKGADDAENKANALVGSINRLEAAWARFGSVTLAPTITTGIDSITASIQTLQALLDNFSWQKLANAGVAAMEMLRTLSEAFTLQGMLSWIARAVTAWSGLFDLVKQGMSNMRQMQAPDAPLPEPGGIPMARGGLLGGRGTGTSDSNLAWLSRGEYVTPAHAVRQPGVLAMLEALRRSGGNLRGVLDGMGRFAMGGLVPRAIPAFASGGLAAGGSHVTIQFPGLPAISGLRASSDVVDQLHKAAALAQVRSGGRKPSRYS
jgi:hypothetical protein